MAERLSSMEKPPAERFQGRRKLYLVPLMYPASRAPTEYSDLLDRYWQQVQDQVGALAARAGAVARVYHEAVIVGGQEGLNTIERLNPRSHQVAKVHCELGGQLEALDDLELLSEVTDWERCLLIGLLSPKVNELVSSSYQAALARRYEHMAKRIDESLPEGEAGLVFVAENHRIQFPSDIEVFYVAPPALDELHRWLRDRRAQQTRPETEEPAPG